MSSPLVLSGSSIATFMRCALQWRYAYIEKLKSPPNVKQVIGIATHRAVEVNMAQKVETKVDLPTSDVLDAYSDSFEAQRPDIEEPDEDVDKAKDSGVGLVRLYQGVVAPPIQPLWVEREVQFAIDGQPYSGVIDLVEERTGMFGTEHIIRDTKTTARTPTGQNHVIAMTGYSVAFRHETGTKEHDVMLDYLIRTKTPKYLPVSNAGPVSDDAISEFSSIVGAVSAAIDAGLESGDFVPNGLTNGACSWCGYAKAGQCEAFNKFGGKA